MSGPPWLTVDTPYPRDTPRPSSPALNTLRRRGCSNAGPFVALSSFLMPTHQSPCGCPTRRLTGTVRTRTEYQPQHHHRTYNTYREGGRALSSSMPCSMSDTLEWLPSALKGSEPKMFSLISPKSGTPPDLGLAYARAARSCQPPFVHSPSALHGHPGFTPDTPRPS